MGDGILEPHPTIAALRLAILGHPAASGEAGDQLANLFEGSVASEGSGFFAHGQQGCAIGKQALEFGKQRLRGDLGLEHHDGRAGGGEDFRVLALVIVGRLRERHEQRGLAGSGELGDGAAGAREHEVAGGVLGGHIVDEGANLPTSGVGSALGVGCGGGLDVAGAGLVKDGQTGDRFEQGLHDER